MAYCTKCGALLQEGAKFCGGCGVSIENPQVDNGRKSVWDGTIHKCPQCGEVLNSFTAKCPSCGLELRDLGAGKSISSLYDNLSCCKTKEEKFQFIKTTAVPNTKEDIIEFMLMASSNFDENYYVTHMDEDDVSDAWLAKIEQCYQKSKITLKKDEDLRQIETIYQEVKRKIKTATSRNGKKKLMRNIIKIAKKAIGIYVGILIILLIFFLLFLK